MSLSTLMLQIWLIDRQTLCVQMQTFSHVSEECARDPHYLAEKTQLVDQDALVVTKQGPVCRVYKLIRL